MADLADAVALTLEQKLTPTIHESMFTISDVHQEIRNSWTNVVRDRGIGRDWKVQMTWGSGVSGGARFQSPRGGNVVSGLDNFGMFSTQPGFPALDETTAPAFFSTEVTLIEHRGNMYLPHQLFRTDKFDASIGSVVAYYMKGVADLLALQEAALFYSDNDTAKELLTFVTPAGSSGAHVVNGSDTNAIRVYLDGTNIVGRHHRFRPGMLVDIYNSAGTLKRNLGFTIAIDDVDSVSTISTTGIPSILLRRVDGGTFQETTALNGAANGLGSTDCNGDVLVIKDSFGTGPSGLATFIKNSGTWFGATIADHSQLKSYIPTVAGGTTASEMFLTKHLAKFKVAFPGRKIDTLIMPLGIQIAVLDSLDGGTNVTSGTASPGRMRYERNGETLDYKGGFSGFSYMFMGQNIDMRTSELCKKGTIYGGHIKDGGLTRYVPPPIPGSTGDSQFGNEVEFIAPLGGTGGKRGIFKMAHTASGGSSDFVEAPFLRVWNVLPAQPNWIKLGTLTEVMGDE